MKLKTNDISKKVLILLGVLFTAARLFLAWTQYATIYPPLAPIDDHFMFTAAQNIVAGDWFGDYNYLTLSKHAFFAVWLAFLHIVKVPFMVGNAALWAFTSVVTVMAFAPLIKKNRAKLFLYLGMLYNPAVWAQFSTRVYRDSFFPSLCILFFACIVAVGLRYKQPIKNSMGYMIGYGVTFGVVYLSREDGIWVLPFAAIAFVIVAVLWLVEKHKGAVVRIVSLAMPFVLSAAVICSYCYMNYTHYGRFIVSDFTSSDQMTVGGLVAFAIGELAVGGDQPGHIGRAAGACMPCGTLRQHMIVPGYNAGYAGINGQRIHVEKALAVQRHACKSSIVQLKLHQIGIAPVRPDRQHIMGKEGHGNRGAGLTVAAVGRQIIIHGEGLMPR